MKKNLLFYLLYFLLFILKTKAQVVLAAPAISPAQIIQPYHIPSINNVAQKITPFSITLKQPQAAGVTPRFSINNANEQCALLRKIIPLLNLEGNRTAAALISLEWEARQLYNKKGFEVQRSIGDTSSFKTFAFVAAYAKPADKEEYKLPDFNENIKTTYYRLKQIKQDSGYAYSNIIAIKGMPQFNLFPNPVADILYIKLQIVETGNGNIMVYDNKGTLVLKQPTTLVKDIINTKSVSMHSLPAGMYSVKFFNADTLLYSQKFIKQ
jgi:hypothetical protein